MQRAKRALKAQLKLRGEAAQRAQQLRDVKESEGLTVEVGSGDEDGNEWSSGKEELEELKERIVASSKVCKG